MATQTMTADTMADFSTTIPMTAIIPISSQEFSTSSTLCTSPSCPVSHTHNKGIYTPVSRNEIGPEACRMFSPSIPPPHVLAAFERYLHEGMSTVDMKIWVSFHESHTEPLIDSTDLRWVTPEPAGQIDEYLDSFRHQTSLGSMTKTKNIVARHPFGLNNPPESVWASHARLQRDDWDQRHPDLVEEDREFVGAFSARSGYCAEGVGELVVNVRRFKVRRLSLVRQLAEIRKKRR